MRASVGLPGRSGCVGEWRVRLGAFNAPRWWAGVAAAGVILAAVYLLWAYQRVFHGPASGANAETPDLRWREGLVMAPFIAAIVFMGVYPKPVIERIEPAVDAIIAHVGDNVAGFAEPVADVHPSVSLEDLARSTDKADHNGGGAEHSGGDSGVGAAPLRDDAGCRPRCSGKRATTAARWGSTCG